MSDLANGSPGGSPGDVTTALEHSSTVVVDLRDLPLPVDAHRWLLLFDTFAASARMEALEVTGRDALQMLALWAASRNLKLTWSPRGATVALARIAAITVVA